MAVEIKEIVIKAVVREDGKSAPPADQSALDQTAIIQECVAQVLKVLQKKNRR
ncbi:MAG: DUF5908 family protein [Bacteroidota bacterium]